MQSDKGFTAYFISHSGKTHRKLDISGWKLILLRAGLAFMVILFAAAVIVTALGLMTAGELTGLREQVSRLQDSLTIGIYTDARLNIIEDQLEQILADRILIENMAGLLPPDSDTLP